MRKPIVPAGMKRAADWWLRVLKQVGTLTGILYLAIAISLWTVVLLDQPLVNWLTMIFGLLFALGALLCLRPLLMRQWIGALILKRSALWIRGLGAVLAALGVWLLWVGLGNL